MKEEETGFTGCSLVITGAGSHSIYSRTGVILLRFPYTKTAVSRTEASINMERKVFFIVFDLQLNILLSTLLAALLPASAQFFSLKFPGLQIQSLIPRDLN